MQQLIEPWAIDTHVIRILAAFQRDIDTVFSKDWVHYVTSLYLAVVELCYVTSCFGYDSVSIEKFFFCGL